MYSSTPPRPDAAPDPGGGWGLRRAVRLAFPEPAVQGRESARVAQLDTYLSDLLRPFGLALEPGALERGGQSYGEMAEALIKAAVPEGESIDLLILAYAIPDITPGRATTTYLSHICPGRPMAFAISDQGTAAAFTALRLIREYAREGDLRRALLLVVEQAALPYDPGVPVTVPAGNAGVALLFGDPADESGPPHRPVGLASAAVHAGSSDSAFVDKLDTLSAAPGETTVILGAGLTAWARLPDGVDRLRLAPAGQPYTGVWWVLAGLLSEVGPRAERLVLTDYEPGSRYLCLAAFDMAPEDPGPMPRNPALVDSSLV